MIEREPGRGRHDENADVGDPVVPSDITLVSGLTSGDEARARGSAFRAALDKVMADHHNVLAALAK